MNEQTSRRSPPPIERPVYEVPRRNRPSLRRSRPLVYVAAPLVLVAEDPVRLVGALTLVRDRYPRARIVNGACSFSDNADWGLRSWRRTRRHVDITVVVPACDGSIGAGCYLELVDTRARGACVEALIDTDFVPWDQVDMSKVEGGTMKRQYEIRRRVS